MRPAFAESKKTARRGGGVMAQQAEKKGFIAGLLEGRERESEYARSAPSSGRWGLFWDIFKGRFSKLVIVNLLMLLFLIPLAVVIFLRVSYEGSLTLQYPFSGDVLAGLPAYPNMSAVPAHIALQLNVPFGALMLAAALVASVGLSGGIYVIRNMLWTEGVFSAGDFWRGIKANVAAALESTLFCGAIVYGLAVAISRAQLAIAVGAAGAAPMIFCIVLCCIAIAVVALMYLWMLSLGADYDLNFLRLVADAFLMTFTYFFHSILFVALMALPVLFIFLGSLFQAVGLVIMVLFGISYAVLVWLDFTQWVYDRHRKPQAAPAAPARSNVAEKAAQGKEVRAYEADLEAAMAVRSSLFSRPVKPITDGELAVYELPEAFSREDLGKLRDSKQAIAEDADRYAEEHRGDAKYVEYNARFDRMQREREERERQAAKGAKKKKGKDTPPPAPEGGK